MEINEVNFPDNVFREYVLNKSDFDKDKNGFLSDDEISTVTELRVSDEKNITSLQGMEYFTSIKKIFCRGLEKLTEIDTTGCPDLEWLDCAQTGITKLDLSSNHSLKILDCHGSYNLKDLDLKANTALTDLDCYNTGITKLDISSNTNLRTLECYDDSGKGLLTELNVKNNVALEELNCHGTGIETLDISQNPNLSQLYCYSTNIKELDVSKNPKLWYLWCYDTDIEGLDVSKNSKLANLNCGKNLGSTRNGLSYLNIGDNRSISVSSLNNTAVNFIITGDAFNISEKFSGIKTDKITKVTNADYDSATGIFKVENPANPIKYEYNCGTNKGKVVTLQVTLNLTVQKGNSTITLKPEIASKLNKVYDGQAVSLTKDDFTVTGSNGVVNLNYYQQDVNNNWIKMNAGSVPIHGGQYRVTATLAGNAYYNGATSTPVEFTISPAENTWTKPLSITEWTYGEKANSPTAEAKSGSEVKFTYSDQEDGTYTETVPENAGTWYVKAIAAATSDYEELTAIKEFTIAKAKAPAITLPENLSATQDDKLESIKLLDGWTWVDGDITVKVHNSGYSARLKVDDANYDYTSVEGYNAKGHYVERTLSVQVAQGTNAWTVEPSINGWTYNEKANAPTGTAEHGTVVFTYSNSKDGNFTSEVPSTAGTWYLKASVPETAEYKELSEIIEFKIAKAVPEYEAPKNLNAVYGQTLKDVTLLDGFTWEDPSQSVGNAGTNKFKAVYTPKDTNNYQTVKDIELTITVEKAENTWTQPLKITGWTYGEKPNTPTATAKYGMPTFQYSNQKDGTYTEKVPTSIGTWYVKAIVAGTANYSGLESEPVSFTISQRWVPSRPTDGLHQGSDGELWYYKDGKIDKTFEGIVEYNGSQFYVKDGKVQKIDGLTLVKDKWYFLTEGRVQTQHTGLVQYDGEWFYITEGILDTSISGVVPYDGGEFVFTQGRLIQELNGLWLNPGDNTWYFIANGQVQRDYTGLALYDGHWFHVVKGVFDQTYTGLVLYDNAWFYVTKGELNPNISGVVPYDGGKFIFSAGRLANEVNGLWLNPKDKKWYFAANGQIQTQYTGVAMYDNEWFYIRKGILATDYNGTIQYNGATFRVRAGQLYEQVRRKI